MKNPEKLTEKFIKDLEPTEKRYDIRDHEIRNLCLTVYKGAEVRH